MAAARNIADLQLLARKALPGPVWNYLEGGADDEVTKRRNTAIFDDVLLTPEILTDVSNIDTRISMLNIDFGFPVIMSPTGMSQLFHPSGEMAVARAAADHAVPYALSTMATTTIEEVAQIGGRRFFQLYCFKDRRLTSELLDRAKASGYDGIILTADTPVSGNRERDLVSGMSVPMKFPLKSLIDFSLHPKWSLPMLFGKRVALANMTGGHWGTGSAAGVIAMVNGQMDRSITWKDLDWLRATWNGSLILKGVSAPIDAVEAAKIGCDGLMISNHGGRQLDGAVTPLEQLPHIRDAVGDAVVLILDGGVRRGTHILKALALGADACAIGRPYIFGLAAGGPAGVHRALQILRTEFERGMALLGVRCVADIRSRHVRWSGQQAATDFAVRLERNAWPNRPETSDNGPWTAVGRSAFSPGKAV
ncbi:alpha-hydroxy-acid oxidizing enzyme [Sphingobium sp. SCG-1]|nr:alpha-hydroxy-acid oxidizing enzyme [Sphingobium sp. SCG-1]